MQEKLSPLSMLELERFRLEREIAYEKSRFIILMTLLASERPLSFTQLRELIRKNPGTLQHHLDLLIKKGLVKKSYLEKHGRSEHHSIYIITPKGREILGELGLLKAEKQLKKLFLKIVSP